MYITGTHFNYFMLCHRKLWLFSNGIQMEHTSELVLEGKLIHENSYTQRSEKFKEIEIAGVRIDYYDPKEQLIHEIKKSDKKEEAHEWQLKYYIFVLQNAGIACKGGLLEYPKLRKTEEVLLTEEDRILINQHLQAIERITQSETCPEALPEKKCSNCSYFDFCHTYEPTNE